MPPTLQLSLPLPRPQPGAERGDSLADRLCALLARRGRPLEIGHVAAQVLRLRRCPERLQRRLVAEIVDGDSRLAWLGRDLVGLAPPAWHATGLDQATFCVVDLETTGGSPGSSKVTEIGAVRITGLRPTARFTTLVDPGRPIPPVVTELTGIDDGMVAGQPDIETALADFVAFAGDDVLVAHNAPFDLRFLNYERRRLAGRYFTQPWLDTLVLARRLLRGRVERHDLGTLAAWADTAVRPVHRALPDAEATAELFVTFAGLLAERGLDTLQRAVSFAGTSAARHAHKLALAEDLPQLPGVYLMRDRDGEVLYIGKAANLRRRVRSYFGPEGRHGRLIGRALEGLHRLDHEVYGSEFEALLRESRLLKEHRPPCNRRGIGGGGGRYLKLTLGEPFPRLYSVPRPAPDGAAYFGPVRSDRTLRRALEALHRLYPLRRCHPICAAGSAPSLLHPASGCAGPCGGGDGEGYARAVDEMRRLLEGDPRASAGGLARRLSDAAAAGGLADDEELCDGIAAVLGTLAALARARWAQAAPAVLVESGREPGTAVGFFVAGGRVRHRAELPRRAWRRPARQGLALLRAAEEEPPALLAADLLDEAFIVAERLRERRGSPGALRLDAGWEDAPALAAIGRAVAAAAAEVPAPDPETEAVPV